jgi:hypothetical protein
MIPIIPTRSAALAATIPPLHYRCRSILSPVTIYDPGDMQKAGWKDPEGKTLQQKMDLGGMPELPKGLGNVETAAEKHVDNSPEKEGESDRIGKKGQMGEEKRAIIDKIFSKKKINIPSNVLKESEADTRRGFKNDVALIENQLREVNFSRFPSRLLEFMTRNEDYNITVVSVVKKTDDIGRTIVESQRPGSYNRDTKILQISAWALEKDTGHFEEETTHLLDHILGSDCKELLGTLSSGIGITRKIESFGKEINSLFYSHSKMLGANASKNPREFLAESIKSYLIYPDLLQREVPEVYNMIDRKFLNNDFWKAIL